MGNEKKLWGGRFQSPLDPRVERLARSLAFDRRLLGADITASQAYARGLARAGVLASADAERLVAALADIGRAVAAEPRLLDQSDAEDVHTFIEQRLVERLGDLGKKLHTGRSRNDQVATALRLWLCGTIDDLNSQLVSLAGIFLTSAEKNADVVMPGYTHLQRAQPILWAHWCLAYVEMLARDRERLTELRHRVNVLPLGSAALAGTSYPLDRAGIAHDLGFAEITANSLDAVSDRDFVVECVSAAALIMVHLARAAEDLILFASHEFGFLSLGDAVATGSSLMPQKKNPDPLELVRGKTGRVVGDLVALLTMLKGLPLAYNRDLQEDKEALFDATDTVAISLAALSAVIEHVELHTDRMNAAANRGYQNATELADYLVKKEVPFRAAHELVGKIVLLGLERGKELHELPLAELQALVPAIRADVFAALTTESALRTKDIPGGTNPQRVHAAIVAARAKLTG